MNDLPEITAANVNAWLGKAVQDVTETMFEQAAYPEETLVETAGAEETGVACIGLHWRFSTGSRHVIPTASNAPACPHFLGNSCC